MTVRAWILGLGTAALALGVSVPAATQPVSGRGGKARASFDLVRAYLSELRNPLGEAPASGPREFRLQLADGSAETAPIGRLAAMLRNCRKASFGASWGNPAAPAHALGNQHWECLGPGAEDKSVLVTAESSDGKIVENVTARLGGQVVWPGPAPMMGPRPSAAETAALAADKEKVFAYLGSLAGGQAEASAVEVVLLVDKDRRPISSNYARQLLAPCDRRGASRQRAEFGGAPRTGVVISWKCDKRSGAYTDLQGWITVSKGAVDRFYISPSLDYAIPAATASQE